MKQSIEIKTARAVNELERKQVEPKAEVLGKVAELKRAKSQFVDNSRGPDG